MKSIEPTIWKDFVIGDEIHSFSKVYSSFSGSLFTYSFNITKDSDASFEIVDLLILKFSQLRPSYKNVEELRSLLFKSCQNRSLNFLRSKRRRANVHLEAFRGHSDVLGNIEDTLVRRDQYHAILEVIALMPSGMQSVIVHSFINDRSAKEIATLLKMSETTVYSQKSQAIKRLRQQLR